MHEVLSACFGSGYYHDDNIFEMRKKSVFATNCDKDLINMSSLEHNCNKKPQFVLIYYRRSLEEGIHMHF